MAYHGWKIPVQVHRQASGTHRTPGGDLLWLQEGLQHPQMHMSEVWITLFLCLWRMSWSELYQLTVSRYEYRL